MRPSKYTVEQLVPEPLGLGGEWPGVRPLPPQTTRGRERQHVWALGRLLDPETGSHVLDPCVSCRQPRQGQE